MQDRRKMGLNKSGQNSTVNAKINWCSSVQKRPNAFTGELTSFGGKFLDQKIKFLFYAETLRLRRH